MILSGLGFSLAGIWGWLLLGGAVGIGFSVLSVIVQLLMRNDVQVRARLVQAFVDVVGHDSIAPSKQVCHPFRGLESK